MFQAIYNYFVPIIPSELADTNKQVVIQPILIFDSNGIQLQKNDDFYVVNTGKIYKIKLPKKQKQKKSHKVNRVILISEPVELVDSIEFSVMPYFWSENNKESNKLFTRNDSNIVTIELSYTDGEVITSLLRFCNTQSDEDKFKQNTITLLCYYLNINILALQRDLEKENFKDCWISMEKNKKSFEKTLFEVANTDPLQFKEIEMFEVLKRLKCFKFYMLMI